MPQLVAEFDVRQFEQGVVKIRQGLDTIESEARKAGTGLDRALDKSGGINKTTQSTGRLNTSMKNVAGTAGLLRSGLAGIVTGLSFDAVISELRGFDASMQRALGVTQATGEEFNRLRQLALDLGRETRFSAQEAAEGIVFLGQAGLETSEIIDLLPVSLNLAAGASTDLSRAADVLSNVLSAFQEESGSAAETADILSATLVNSNTNFEQLAIALRQVAPIAANTGTSLETVSAAVGVLGNNAIQGEQAGTALRAIILSLVDPSRDAATAIEGLGLSLDDVNPEEAGLVEAFEALRNANLGTAEASAIFGREAAAAATVLVNQVGSVEDLIAVLETADGSSQALANTLNDSLEGAILGAQSAFSGLVQAIGDAGATDALEAGFRNAADALNELTDDIRDSEGIALPFFEFLGSNAVDALSTLSGGLIDVGDELEAVDQFFGLAGDSVGALTEEVEESAERLEEVGELAEEVADRVERYGIETDAAAEAAEAFNDALEDHIQLLSEAVAETEDLSGGAGDYRDAANQATVATNGFAESFAGLGLVATDTFDVIALGADDVFGTQLPSSVEDFTVFTEREFQDLADGLTGILSAFGVEISGIFGDILDFFGAALPSSLSSSTGAIQSFGQIGVDSLTGVGGAAENLQGQVGGLGGQIDGLNVSIQSLLTNAAAGAALGAQTGVGPAVGLITGPRGATAGAIVGAAGGSATAQGGAALGSSIGSGIGTIGGPVGIVAGSVVGGAIGGAIGEFGPSALGSVGSSVGIGKKGSIVDEILELDAEKQEIDAFAAETISIFSQISSGAVIAGQDIRASLGKDAADVIEDLNDAIGEVGDAFQDLELDTKVAKDAFEELDQKAPKFDVLSNAATVAASQIGDAFQVSGVDILAFLNTLPPGVADTFSQIEENSQFIAEQLAAFFGVSVDEVLTILNGLTENANQILVGINDGAEFAAAGLASVFGVSVKDIEAIFDTLPEGTVGSFQDIVANADLIARNLAVTFGVPAEEIKAILLSLAEQAGLSLSEIGTTGGDVAQQLVDGFSGTSENLGAIFAKVLREGSDVFENIRQNADGSFELIDEDAQEKLERLVEKFGGTEQDIQLILGLLASNADISLQEILASGVLAFDGLGEKSEEALREILEDFGIAEADIDRILLGIPTRGEEVFNELGERVDTSLEGINAGFGATEEEIAQRLDGIAIAGDEAFQGVSDASAESVAAILAEFGIAEGDIAAILAAIAENGDVAFGALNADALAAIGAILADFGLAEDQIAVILAAIAGSGEQSAARISGSFSAALGQISGDLSALQGAADFTFSNTAASADAAAARIRAAFGGAAASAAASIGDIQGAAARARDAIASIPPLPNAAPTGFATGGIITGPVTLSSASAFGQSAFARGGVLTGLTGISANDNLQGPFNAIAGEAGPEAILPLTETSDGLGVTAKISGGGNRTQIIFIEGVDRRETDKLKARLLQLDAEIDFRAGAAAEDLLLGAA